MIWLIPFVYWLFTDGDGFAGGDDFWLFVTMFAFFLFYE